MVAVDDIAALVVWYTVSALVVQPAAKSAASTMNDWARTPALVIEPIPDPNASLQWLTDTVNGDGRPRQLFLAD